MGTFVTSNTPLPPLKTDFTPPQGLSSELDAADINNLWAAAGDLRDQTTGWVNVKSSAYGAKGDGVTDDTAAITAAIAALPASGGVLLFPAGSTYKISDQFTITKPYTRIVGYGAKIVQTGTLKRGFTLSAVGCIVEGLWLYNNNGNTEWADAPAGSTNAIGIYIDGGDSAKVLHCQIEQWGYAAIRVHSSKHVLIYGNELIGIGATKPLLLGANNNIGVEGYLSGALSRGLRVINNSIHDFAQGVLTSFDWLDLTISGNNIHDIQGQHGMYLDNVLNATVTNNTVKTCGQNGIKLQISANATIDCENVTVSGNAVDSAGAAGIIVLPATTGLTPRFRNIVIVANTVRNSGAVGISVDHAENWNVADNTISGAGTFGISTGLESKSGRIAGNLIENTQQTGIYLQATSTSFVTWVKDNTIDSPGLSAAGTSDLRAVIYMGTGRWILADNIFLNTGSCSSHVTSLAAVTHTLRRNIDPGTKNNSTVGTVTAEGLTVNTVSVSGSTVTPNLSTTGHLFEQVSVAAWTLALPINLDSRAEFTLTVSNTSAGAIVTTWPAAANWKMAAWTEPAAGFNRTISFRRNNNTWYEVSRTTADVPN